MWFYVYALSVPVWDVYVNASGNGSPSWRSRLIPMNQDMIATVLTGIGVIFGVWRLVHVESESVRRDLAAQISAVTAQLTAVNPRIDNVLLASLKNN